MKLTFISILVTFGGTIDGGSAIDPIRLPPPQLAKMDDPLHEIVEPLHKMAATPPVDNNETETSYNETEYSAKIAEMQAKNNDLQELIDAMTACQAEVDRLTNECGNIPDDPACTGIADLDALLTAISNAAGSNEEPTVIPLCPNTYFEVTSGPISVEDKAVVITCESPGNCTFDGGKNSNIFDVRFSSASFDSINFVNGNATLGGAVYLYYSDPVEFSGCTFSGNAAEDGGAIRPWSSSVQIKASSFLENLAYDGGAIAAGGFSEIEIATGTDFTRNQATRLAGAILSVSSSVSITASSFSENFAEEAGAIDAQQDSQLEINGGTTFSGNEATGYGGAILGWSSNVNIESTSFLDNVAQYGGATFFDEAKVDLSGTTFSGSVSSGGLGADLLIVDDENPDVNGTYVNCDDFIKVIFCDGKDDTSQIYQHNSGSDMYDNTDCDTVGATSGSSCGTGM